MNLSKYLFSLMAVAVASWGYASIDYSTNDFDINALKQVEKNKSVINILNKGGNLFLSGDVRATWLLQSRKSNASGFSPQIGTVNGFKELGSGSGNSITNGGSGFGGAKPNNRFVSEVNLRFAYDADCSWAQIGLQFKDRMGTQTYVASDSFPSDVDGGPSTAEFRYVGDEQNNRIYLKTAFVGYDFIHCGPYEFYAEVGRQKLDYIFESKVQFNSTFDGLLVGFDYGWEDWGDFFIHGGGMVVNDVVDHFGWIGEVGMMELFETGLYAKYSFTHWHKNGVSTSWDAGTIDGVTVVDDPFTRYNVSQLVLGYVFQPCVFCVPTRLYAAGLYNHAAKKTPAANNQKQNWGWYAGVELGKLEVAGDWALDVSYQWVGYQAIPQFDVSGIGNGYDIMIDSSQLLYPQMPSGAIPSPGIQPASTILGGNTNYKGFDVTGFYNVTTNLALRAKFAMSNHAKNAIGGKHTYRDFELGVVYTF